MIKYFLVESDTGYDSIFVTELKRDYDSAKGEFTFSKGDLRFNHVDAARTFGTLRALLTTKEDIENASPLSLIAPIPGGPMSDVVDAVEAKLEANNCAAMKNLDAHLESSGGCNEQE